MGAFTLGGHAYEGPEPAGTAGMELYGRVMRFLAAMDMASIAEVDGAMHPGHLQQIIVLGRMLVAHPLGREAALATLQGWKVDDQRITAESFDAIYAVPGRWSEAGEATIRIWKDAGFFRGAGSGPAPVKTPAATPAND